MNNATNKEVWILGQAIVMAEHHNMLCSSISLIHPIFNLKLDLPTYTTLTWYSPIQIHILVILAWRGDELWHAKNKLHLDF